jgi:hypothetical protein
MLGTPRNAQLCRRLPVRPLSHRLCAPSAVSEREAEAAGIRRVLPSVWALVGIAAYALDRPHGSMTAGAVVEAAAYELTPVKRHFRRRCARMPALG